MVEEVDQQLVVAPLCAEVDIADPDRAKLAAFAGRALWNAGPDRGKARDFVCGIELIGQIIHGPGPLMGVSPDMA